MEDRLGTVPGPGAFPPQSPPGAAPAEGAVSWGRDAGGCRRCNPGPRVTLLAACGQGDRSGHRPTADTGRAGAPWRPLPQGQAGVPSGPARGSRAFFLSPSLVELKSDRGKSGAGLRPGRLGLPAPGAIPAGGTVLGPPRGREVGRLGNGPLCLGAKLEEELIAGAGRGRGPDKPSDT